MNAHKKLIGDLRGVLANAIANYKSYEVPALCERLGLAAGDKGEAFNSKFRYASTRLQALRPERVIDAARQFLDDNENFELAELVAKIDEYDRTHVSDLTRRRIIGLFEGEPLSSELDHVEFIKRVWPIALMPSPYGAEASKSSSGTLEDAIYQHTVRNDDWTQQELLQFLGLLSCSQQQFFRFLQEVTDPIVQSAVRQAQLIGQINDYLKHDGFALRIKRRMSGSPVYAVVPLQAGAPSDLAISATLQAFNPDTVHARWEAALERRANNPEGAITLSRTLLEDVCKWIIHEAGETYEEKDDLPALYRKLAGILNLAPDLHTEQVFKQILGSCQSIVESLGSLRNKISDAHSEGPLRVKPSARHAELAVNLAGTMATFLVSTWRFRQADLTTKT
ncbi:abortive infection family protein [Hoeflea sp.]|uniref:abortive infection family protein n=1 Tax=Hoeflea sp. TaxID=1940281 RepID=UPI003A95431A